APPHEVGEVDSALAAAEQSDDDEPALDREAAHVARHVIAAHHVEHEIHAVAAGLLLDDLDEILGPVVDRALGAELDASLAFGGRAGGGVDRGAERLRKLDCGRADAARAAVDQDALAGLEAA